MILLFLSILLVTFTKSSTCLDEDLFVIRSAASPEGLVLDGRNSSQITIQHYNGFNTQLWIFQRFNRPDVFYIINKHSGEALDFEKKDNTSSLVTKNREDSLRQQWRINVKGNIINLEENKNIDITKMIYKPGNKLIIFDDNGCECQLFTFEKKV